MSVLEIPTREKVNWRWYASTLVAVDIFFWVFRFLYEEWCTNLPFGQTAIWLRGARYTNAVLATIGVLTVFLMKSRRVDRVSSNARQAMLAIPLILFLSFHVQSWYMHQKSAWLFMEDVGRTTIAADHLIMHGQNPYAAPIDTIAASLVPQAHLDGYKYLPVMMAAYSPVALVFKDGDWAVLAANLIFSIIGAALLFACMRKWVSTDAALLGTLFFFIPEIISQEQISNGANDMVPMIFLLAAIYALDRRFLCGLLVGLAISAKLLPGLLWLPICLTPARRGRYFAGVAVGVAPCLPFLAWNPHAFLGNIVFYNLIRPMEITSLFYQSPRVLRWLAQAVVICLFAGLVRRTWRAEMPPIQRCGWATILALAVTLTGPMNHPNYFIWWFMPFCAVLANALMNPVCYEWMGGGANLTRDVL
jgi:hypothetical protein